MIKLLSYKSPSRQTQTSGHALQQIGSCYSQYCHKVFENAIQKTGMISIAFQ